MSNNVNSRSKRISKGDTVVSPLGYVGYLSAPPFPDANGEQCARVYYRENYETFTPLRLLVNIQSFNAAHMVDNRYMPHGTKVTMEMTGNKGIIVGNHPSRKNVVMVDFPEGCAYVVKQYLKIRSEA